MCNLKVCSLRKENSEDLPQLKEHVRISVMDTQHGMGLLRGMGLLQCNEGPGEQAKETKSSLFSSIMFSYDF